MTRIQIPPDSVDRGIAFFKETVAPAARSAPGNAGAVLLVDRKNGLAIDITLWETTQALNASETIGINSRTQSTAATGATILNVERYEQVIWDRTQPAKVGSFVRVNAAAGTPDRIDDVIKFMEKALPTIKALKGRSTRSPRAAAGAAR
jgi:hypothetical protein